MNISLAKLWLFAALPLAGISAAQAQVSNVQRQPDIVYSVTPSKYILGGLTVDEIPGYDHDLLESISGLEVGKIYAVPGTDITDAVRRYWQQKLFSNVKITADSIVDNRIYLHVHLTAQPRISSISYSGVKKSEREDLEKRLGLQNGSQITPDMVNRAKIIIKRYFDEKGFKDAEVDIQQKEDATADNRVLVNIDIDKHSKVHVNRIYISGVTPKEASKLKRAMKKTHERTLLNFLKSKKFLPEKYGEDKDNVVKRLNAWGYRDAVLKSDSVAKVDDGHVDVYLDLSKGQKYYIRNISWVGNTVYNTDVLERILQMKKGDVYNQTLLHKRLSEDEDAVGNLYYNNGYVFYNLDPAEVNVVGDSIDLEMRIQEGRQARFNRVNITGNDRVYENVVRRELFTKPGDLFSMEAIKRSVMALAQMNQFDAEALQNGMNKGIKPDPYNGTVDITYPLVSKGGDQLQLSIGWGPTGIVGQAGIKFTNFSIGNLFSKGNRHIGFIPQGDGQTLAFNVQTNGTYYQAYSLSFLDPWFGGKRPNQLSVSLSYSKQSDMNSSYYNNSYYNNYYYNYLSGYGNNSNYYNYTNYYDPDKYVKLLGLSLGFGKRLRWPDDYFTFTAQLNYTRYMLKSWKYFIIHDGNCNNFNISLALNRNSTDNTFYPRRGSELELSVAFTPPYSLWDGKDYKNLAANYKSFTYQKEMQEKFRWVEYNKWKFKLRTFTALTGAIKAPVLMTRMEFGLLGAYNRYKKSPFEAYYVGGDGMSGYSYGYSTETIGLRGYENGSIAGDDGNNAYAYSRMALELRYPLLLEGQTNVFVLGFVEGGNAWTDARKFNPFNMKRSAGIGVRLMLPMVGMLGIDWAYGFQRYNANGQKIGGSQFHFILNQEF